MLRFTVICLSVILSVSAARIQCPSDKIYNSCGSRCPPTCSEPNRPCTLECVPGCFCHPGQLLNDEGNCVTPENCKVSSDEEDCECTECADDEVYMECGSMCPQTCEPKNPMQMCPAVCVKGCFCPPGKVRSTTSGRCVDLASCRRCPENEEYNQCGTHCPLTCQRPNPVPCTKNCALGCFCKNGTIRDQQTNKCVNPEQCSTCGPNEEFNECGTACPKTCSNLNPTVCTKQCVIGCACKEGFVKDEITNKCVNPKKCKCPGNEIFNSCGSACPATCKKPKPTMCTMQCVPGCYCPKGLLRDEVKKQCVKPDKCSKCPGNEVFKSCGSACPATCKNPKPTVCTEQCISGCFCPEGYVRDEATKQCVKPSQCAKCPGNEVFNTCGTACPATCKNPKPTVCTEQCIAGCFCPEGFVRDEVTKQCVKPSQCTKCPGIEIFRTCGTACPATCTNLKPTICTLQCVTGCFCPEGYVRDKNTGKCVKPANCTCPKNEIFKECGTACPQTCSQLEPMKCTAQCVSGCFCADDLVRDTESNKCVKTSECSKNCKEGEIYEECGSACPSTCDKKQNDCTQQCVPGCQCQNDLVRDVISGKCISPAQCPINDSSCPPNEFFNSCGTNCEPTCSAQNPVCNKACKIGCFCEDGFIRNSENLCIKKESC